jgi:hypothetical protein
MAVSAGELLSMGMVVAPTYDNDEEIPFPLRRFTSGTPAARDTVVACGARRRVRDQPLLAMARRDKRPAG